jgi:hypothetical protein
VIDFEMTGQVHGNGVWGVSMFIYGENTINLLCSLLVIEVLRLVVSQARAIRYIS